MKKAIFAMIASLVLVSCGGSSEEVVSPVDSLSVADSSAVADSSVAVLDSTVSEIGAQEGAQGAELGNPTKQGQGGPATHGQPIK